MASPACVERDIDRVARYWQLRKFQFFDKVADEFLSIVQPAVAFVDEPDPDEAVLVSLAMTEWFLFDRAYRDGRTPLECFIEDPPRDVRAASLKRLRQVARTQFFSRFSILSKDRPPGFSVLEDTRTGSRYDVYDQHLRDVDRWCDGVIAERIGYVDGRWQLVGRLHLYDRASDSLTAPDGPGAVHPEDGELAGHWEKAGFYLRLVRDCLGVDGRYRDTVRCVRHGAA